VLTADHGEELYDHAGWKHGRTLYEEVLRVPLLLRWDGQLAAGSRFSAPVSLLDVAPTLLAAAGGVAPAAWEGRDLLPALRGETAPPVLDLYAQHVGDGPRRAAVMRGDWKLVLYDRRSRFAATNRYQTALLHEENARLPRLALFHLASDPRERADLAAAQADVVTALGDVAQQRLGREQAGVRVLLAGGRAGATYDVELQVARGAAAWDSCFLGERDTVSVTGDRIHLRLVGEPLSKGILLPAGARILALRTTLPVRLPGGIRAGGGAIAPAALRGGWPGGAESGAALLLWDPPVATGATRPDDEQLRRLRALGYAG